MPEFGAPGIRSGPGIFGFAVKATRGSGSVGEWKRANVRSTLSGQSARAGKGDFVYFLPAFKWPLLMKIINYETMKCVFAMRRD